MRKILVLSVALVAGVVTAVVVGQLVSEPQPHRAVAQWKNVYRTTGGLVAGADLIVLADHLGAEPGRVVGEGEDATPFTNNTFAIRQLLRGKHDGIELVVEQTGGLMADGSVFDINDGGPYARGATYMLFLKKGEGDAYYVINHQARYEVKDDILEGVDPTDAVVARMHGRTLDSGREMVLRRARMLD
jgi:hypothetical protein